MCQTIIRFAIQGDIHSYRHISPCHQISRSYMVKLINDLPKVKADMFFILGDYADRDYPIAMELSKLSKVPIIYQHGDHEFFGDWTAGLYTRNYEKRRIVGEPCDPLIYMFGGIPRCEAWTGLPRFWSFIFKGIHFIISFNGKFEVWPTYFLKWLDMVLKEYKDLTTVILGHRPLYEDGSCAKAMREIFKRNRQIKLYCYAHKHEGDSLSFLGEALQVPAELLNDFTKRRTYEGDWYVLIEISNIGIRILKRNFSKCETDLVYLYKTRTTIGTESDSHVHLPYIIPDKGSFSVPTLWLENAKARIWSLSKEEILPDPLLKRGLIIWKSLNGAKISIVKADKLKLSLLDIHHAIKIKVKEIKGSLTNPVRICETILPVKFNIEGIGESGSINGGVLYDFLLIAQVPIGRRLRLIVEGIAPEGNVESHQYIDIIGCNGISSAVLKVGHLRINGKWHWMSFHTKSGEVMVKVKKPRRANRLKVSLAVPEYVRDAGYFFILLVYSHEGMYTLVDEGISFSSKIKLKINNRCFYIGDIGSYEFKEIKIGNLIGGSEIGVQCDGSRLVIVELIGKASAIFQHLVYKVRKLNDEFIAYDLSNSSKLMLKNQVFQEKIGKYSLIFFKKVKVRYLL